MGENSDIVVIGAGPAGLTAAYELAKHGHRGIVVEADNCVGGLARTVNRDGYLFDIGPHRFFTKVKEIEDLWHEILDEPMMKIQRLTRIFYGGKFFDYPLRATNALWNMGPFKATHCLLSYFWARLHPIKDPKNFQEWVTNQFGAKLFNMFFKSYTEKVWGVPCTEIGADWAAQRIKGLSLGSAVRNAIFGEKKNQVITTLINEFHYPRLGPGQLWGCAARKIQEKGWELRLNTKLTSVRVEHGQVRETTLQHKDGTTETRACSQLFSSMPVKDLIFALQPAAPADVIQAATSLTYRDFITVVLVLKADILFPDNWIYIHSPDVRVARMQDFKNWSTDMVPDQSTTSVGMEYFVNRGDEMWNSPDQNLVDLAYSELKKIGLAKGELVKGFVTRMAKAYPVYDPGYKDRLAVIRAYLNRVENIHCIGRNGQHRYNNQDHSMATALIAARNVMFDAERDPWSVNEDAEYHEIAKTEREAPMTPPTPNVEEEPAAAT